MKRLGLYADCVFLECQETAPFLGPGGCVESFSEVFANMIGDNTIDATLFIFRGIVLVIAALSGGMSILLGWKLYRDGVSSTVSGELSRQHEVVARLSAAGPGIFFAAFGMWLLIHLVDRPATVDKPIELTATATPMPEAKAPSSFAPRSPTEQFYLAQYRPPNPVAPQQYTNRTCVVAIYRRKLYQGNDLTSERIKSDLSLASDVLGESMRKCKLTKPPADIAGAQQTLAILAEGAGNWDLAR